jgi:hypothetical protein
MTFIKTIAESEAVGWLKEYYDGDLQDSGAVSNVTRTFSLRPEAFGGWRSLIKAVRKNMRLRNYELTTFAAAMEMGCTF